MASPKRSPRLLPSPTNPRRTIVIIVLIVIVAIIAITATLALTTSFFSSSGGYKAPSSRGGNVSYSPTSNVTVQNVKLDSYTYTQDPSTSQTLFNVVVTNTGVATETRTVTAVISQNPSNVSSGQPYSNQQPYANNPFFTNSQRVTLAAGETTTVPVVVSTPSWFYVSPNMVLVSLS